MVAIGLGTTVYLWNATSNSTQELCELKEENYVSSVSWSSNGKYLAIGDSSACIQLWDVGKMKKIRTMKGHSERVGAPAWHKHVVAR